MKTVFSPGSVLFLLLIILCAVGNTVHSNPLLFLVGIFFAVLLWNFVAAWRQVRKITFVRDVPKTGFAREEIPCEIELVSRSRHGFSCTAILPFFRVPVLFRLEKVQEFTPRKRETHRVLAYTLEFQRRGKYDLSALQISSGYPFGLFMWARTLRPTGEGRQEITIFPPRRDTSGVWSQLNRPAHAKSAQQTADGDFSGLRLWQEGDALRKIHWRASARHGQLLTARTDMPQPLSVFLIADFTDTDSRRAEEKIALASSLVYDLCHHYAPFTLGAPVTLWVKIIARDVVETLKSEEIDDFCTAVLTLLAQIQRRDPTLPKIDSTQEIATFREFCPGGNLLWVGDFYENASLTKNQECDHVQIKK